jgi:hypothetical protein
VTRAHTGFQVTEHRPWRIWLALALILLLLAMMFFIGRAYQGFELTQLQIIKNTLVSRVDELERRNSTLIKDNAKLKRVTQIEHDAYTESNESLVKLQQEIVRLKEELVFYQGIVSPEQLALGINIQTFDLSRTGQDGSYRYKLVLTKRGKSSQVVKGSFDIKIDGTRDGENVSIGLDELQPDLKPEERAFSFRYFQVFEGKLKLGDGFHPGEIQLMIKPKTRKIEDITESVAWAQALVGGEN